MVARHNKFGGFPEQVFLQASLIFIGKARSLSAEWNTEIGAPLK